MIELKDENFESDVLKSDILVIVDFYATWCGPCKKMGSMLEEIEADNIYKEKIKILKCNIEDCPDTVLQLGILNVPTILFFKDGNIVDKNVGVTSKLGLCEKIEKWI